MDAAEQFRQHCAVDRGGDSLYLPNWTVDDWRGLFSYSSPRVVASGDVLIRHGDNERAMYFLIRGALEVRGRTARGDTLGRLFREQPGAVLGEIALFDGLPRTASVWATELSELLRLDIDGLHQFIGHHPALGNDLLFALGRVLAFRLRNDALHHEF